MVGATVAGWATLQSLAACGLADSDSKRPVIEMNDERQFNPASLRLPRGSRVTWVNSSSAVHTITSNPELAQQEYSIMLPDGVEPWGSGDVYPGGTWSREFEVAGQYVYFCRYHELESMIGTIIIDG